MPMFRPKEPKARAAYTLANRKHRYYCNEAHKMLYGPEELFDEAEFERLGEMRARWADIRRRHAWSHSNRP